jgi:hypothetical protein
MRRLWLIPVLMVSMGAVAGCGEPKTPEEIEAAKYPPVKPNSPEESRKLREEMANSPARSR